MSFNISFIHMITVLIQLGLMIVTTGFDIRSSGSWLFKRMWRSNCFVQWTFDGKLYLWVVRCFDCLDM